MAGNAPENLSLWERRGDDGTLSDSAPQQLDGRGVSNPCIAPGDSALWQLARRIVSDLRNALGDTAPWFLYGWGVSDPCIALGVSAPWRPAERIVSDLRNALSDTGPW